MRMKHIYYLFKKNYDALESFKLESETQKIGTSINYRGKVSNWISTKEALISVSVIPTVKDFCISILNDPFFARIEDSFVIPYETYQRLYPEYRKFLSDTKAIVNFCESTGFDTVEKGFDIKMPSTNNFDEFAKNINLFNKSINQCPYLNIDNEKIILKKTDIGSIWFEFAVVATGASVLLSNLAKIVDKCVKIKSHYITVKQQEEDLRQLTLKNDVLQNVIEAYEESNKALISQCVDELKKEIPQTELKDDDVARVGFALETISKLMEKGMEIYASIDAPPEVQELFPTSDEMTFLPKSRQLLEESEEND